MKLDLPSILKQIQFKTSRSGGKGGQHVNKVETKVALLFSIDACEFLDENQKAQIHKKAAGKINSEGVLHVICQSERSQLANKEKAIKEFIGILKEALKPVKVRKATKPSAAAKAQRLENKKLHSEKKALRKVIF